MRYWSILSFIVATGFGFGFWHQPGTLDTSLFITSTPLISTEQFRADCATPINAVVAENCLSGTDGWQLDNSLDIQIYASEDSVNVGDKLDFFVDTKVSNYRLNIYRIGYYGGLGARLIQSVPDLVSSQQPDCVRMDDSGLRTCSNWQVSYSLTVPLDWVSGIYMAQVKDSTSDINNETVFAIRQDERKSDLLYQMSVTTFQAYNNYGGKSVYSENSATCDTVADAPRAVKVSLNRPYGASFWDPNYFFHTEYPMVRWLEQQGYDVTYSTNMDTYRSGKSGAHNALLDHKAFLSVGHDEYWSQEMHDAIMAARDAGVHIGFFGANTSFWRIRFEPDPITNEPDSVIVTYKTTESGSPDPSGEPTGTWRDPNGANDPENTVLGIMYIGYNLNLYFPLRLSSSDMSDPLFRHTGLQNMPPNTYLDVGGQNQLVGWEWDTYVDNGLSPPVVQILAKSSVLGYVLQDAGTAGNGNLQQAIVNTTRYVAPSGAIVFASGTIQWAQGLGSQENGIVPADPYIAQITYNLFSDMGFQPATPVSSLILDDSNLPDPPLPTDQLKTVGSVKEASISHLHATSDDTNSTIEWTTNVETKGQIWYGAQPEHITYGGEAEPGYSIDHKLILTDLMPGQTYYFKVASVDRDWGQTISDGDSFTTTNGSITQRLRGAVAPLVQQGACWVRENKTGTVVMMITAIIFLAVVVAILLRYRRVIVQAAP